MDREGDILGEESAAALGGERRLVRICFRKVEKVFEYV